MPVLSGSALLESKALEPALEAPLALHRARWQAVQAELVRLDRISARYANARTIAFVVSAGLAGLALFNRGPAYGGWMALGVGVLFVILAALHHRIFLKEEAARLRATLSERGVARCSGAWRAFSETGARFSNPDHLCTPDLDVFGQGSLFQLVDQTSTLSGEEMLAGWLSQTGDVEAARARQGAVQELVPQLDFREALALEGRRASAEKADPAGFVRWAEGPSLLDSVRWCRPMAWVLPPLSLVLYLLGREGLLHPRLWLMTITAQVLILLLTRKTFNEYFLQLSEVERAVARLGPAFAELERQGFRHPRLQALVAGMLAGGESVSKRLGHFSRLLAFAELRYNGQVYAVVNALTLWDIHWLFPLEGWRRRHGAQVRAWFDALAEMEALGSLAGFAHDRPHFCFPELSSGTPAFEARGLGHPLLDHPVRNDVALLEPKAALLLTGSNMSGKTTLVRAMGANALLAFAGAPVCADALRLSDVRILTSMRVKDSLERGVSYFYAEVQRLKAVLEAAEGANGRALFLLDEILLGTNTRERQIASREVLRLLLATGAIGAVTTHDLSLAELAQEKDFHVRNVHFRDLISEGRMTFDYRLREGVVDTSNALRVLRQAGIPIPEA